MNRSWKVTNTNVRNFNNGTQDAYRPITGYLGTLSTYVDGGDITCFPLIDKTPEFKDKLRIKRRERTNKKLNCFGKTAGKPLGFGPLLTSNLTILWNI